MQNSRLEQLKAMLKEDPEDPFLLYGLALEYRNSDHSKAEEYFLLLLDKYPDYHPTYYHAAQFFIGKGDKEKVYKIFEKGLEVCKKGNHHHAFRELQSAYNIFKDEFEGD